MNSTLQGKGLRYAGGAVAHGQQKREAAWATGVIGQLPRHRVRAQKYLAVYFRS
ncbi:hypothetical protein KCP76_03535 [Salmonella enterica subsp. enterica serovar Weltevreden]|nr:hypothetical protein KCP76_03535 [Salmonella enterica subsp. enterica serovar Weltevreden]